MPPGAQRLSLFTYWYPSTSLAIIDDFRVHRDGACVAHARCSGRGALTLSVGGAACACGARFAGPECETCAHGFTGADCSMRVEALVCPATDAECVHGTRTADGNCACNAEYGPRLNSTCFVEKKASTCAEGVALRQPSELDTLDKCLEACTYAPDACDAAIWWPGEPGQCADAPCRFRRGACSPVNATFPYGASHDLYLRRSGPCAS